MVWFVSAKYGTTGKTSVFINADSEYVARRKVEDALRSNGLRRVCIDNCEIVTARR